jgi:phage tail protein X
MRRLVEQTLDINPGLAGLGSVLPLATRFKLPIVRPPVAPARSKNLARSMSTTNR